MTLVVRAGHSHTKQMSFRPDGKVLATLGTHEPGLSFWRVRDGELLGTFQGHPGQTSFALSQNRLLTYHPGQLRLWRTTHLDDHGFEFPQLASFQAEGERLVLTSRFFLFRLPDGRVAMANIQDGSLVHTFSEARWFYTGARGRRVLLGAEKSVVFSGVSGRQVGQLEVGCAVAAFSPEDRWLAAAGPSDRTITLVDPETLKCWPIEGHQKRVLHCAFSQDGLWFASVAEDATLLFLNLEDWQLTMFNTRLGPARMLTWLSGNRVVVGDFTGNYQVFGVTRGGGRAYPKEAPSEPSSGGMWCAGPDNLAAWASPGQSTTLLNLSEAEALARLAPALRWELQVRQQRVGETILVEGRPWSLPEGRPLGDTSYQVISEKLVNAEGGRHRLADGFAFQAPAAAESLRAICEQSRHFAFYEPKTNHLEVLRREGASLLPWRALPEEWRQAGHHAPHFEFSPGGRHLGIYAAEEGPWVWLLDSDRCQKLEGKPYFLPEGGWVNRNADQLEQWDATGQRVATRPLPKDIRALLRSPAGYLVLLNGQGAQLVSLDLEKRLGSVNLADVFRLQLSEDGRWLFALHGDARLSVWSLPSGLRRGEAQQFSMSDLRSLRILAEHGWMVASGGTGVLCWHLESANCQWLGPEFGLPGGVHPLPGGQLLVLTQDGAWHLLAPTLPLQRLASLRTTAAGDYLVVGEERWDATPPLLGRVGRQQGPRLSGADECHQSGLWGTLVRLKR